MSAAPPSARAVTFRHGIHAEDRKEATASRPTERLPFSAEYVLPLSQHTGAPCRPLVSPGEQVRRGQMIAEPDGYISMALHAPVTGTVTAIEARPHPRGILSPAIVLKTDPFSSQLLEPAEPPDESSLTSKQIVERVQQAGLVGLGGAAFPSHVKLDIPEGKKARFTIINGCECEPYLTCDHRLMAERPGPVVRGLKIIMRQVGAERGYIGVEVNKPDAIKALKAASADDDDIRVIPLVAKYPQGAEKMLIDAIFHREVPSGKLPIDLEIVVNNVGTAVSMADLFEMGQPMIERVVTVAGTAVRRPANLVVPIGTPVRDILAFCDGLRPAPRQVILGGPMMGMSQKRLDVPVIKGISGVLAFDRPVAVVAEDPCIRCGRCLAACPMYLNPSRLAQLARHERTDEMGDLNALDCFECGACSFVCPSHIPLVQLIRVGKAMVRQRAQENS